jgi:hypothetical protein
MNEWENVLAGRRWTEKETLFLRENKKKMTAKEICDILGRTESAVVGKSFLENIKKSTSNDNFLLEDSPQFWHFLGLIAADGCLQKRRYGKRLSLILTDKEMIDFYAHKFGANVLHQQCSVKNKNHKDTYGIRMTLSDYGSRRLESLGITERKSLTLQPPIFTPKHVKYMILGYWDGDGSIFIEKKGNYLRSVAVGTFEYLSYLKRHIEIGTDVSGGGIYKANGDNGKNTYQLRYSKNDTIKLLSWLYDGEVYCLERKKRIFFDYIGQMEVKI